MKKENPFCETLILEDEFPLPKKKLMTHPVASSDAKEAILRELTHEGSALLNLATFVQTSMDLNGAELLAETMDKNAIDKTEYPQTTELENRCIDIISDLWHADEKESHVGTSTVGSSEACMLAGMAMKFSWEEKTKNLNLDSNKKPNLIISSAYQICWEKFCVYWDVEMRCIPIDETHLSMDMEKAVSEIDDYTIGIVTILGITYTGNYDDIEKLDTLLEHHNKEASNPVRIHVDAASGGLYAPFMEPDLPWDFRLKNVISINTSGHKYGLVYPGIGWVIWKDKQHLPKKMVFEVSYLGGSMPTIAINFSRSGSQIIGQYYNFLHLGFEGFKKVHSLTKTVSDYISQEIDAMGLFKLYSNGKGIPIVCWSLKEIENNKWTLYDLSDQLRMKGWQVPAYPLPKNLDDIVVLRVVCKRFFTLDMAQLFIEDIKKSIVLLDKAKYLQADEYTDQNGFKKQGFTH